MVALLALVVPLTLSGYGTYNEWGEVLGGDWLEELHEFFGEALLAVVLAHLALIAGMSLLRRKNQALPMLTGRVDGAGPESWSSATTPGWRPCCWWRWWPSARWEWQQSPNGLIPAQGTTQRASDRHHGQGD